MSSGRGKRRAAGGLARPRKVVRRFVSRSALVPSSSSSAPQGGDGEEKQRDEGAAEAQARAQARAEAAAADVSDTEAALLLLWGEFPANVYGCTPVALQSQVYSLVRDRTEVDNTLARLRRENRVRVVSLPSSGREDFCVVRTADLEDLALSFACPAARRFVERVLPAHTETGVTGERLRQLLAAGDDDNGDGSASKRDSDEVELVRRGLLVARHAGGFWFAVPGAGRLSVDLRRGRRELVGRVARKRYKEALESEVLRARLRLAGGLPVRFLLRDALGHGLLRRVSTTGGTLLRVDARQM